MAVQASFEAVFAGCGAVDWVHSTGDEHENPDSRDHVPHTVDLPCHRERQHMAARRRSWSPAPAPDAPREAAVHIEMYLSSTFRVLVNGNVVSPGGKRDRACELLALLALHPEGLAALEIGDALYPDLESDRAQQNVRGNSAKGLA
jgi:hypothetical protein